MYLKGWGTSVIQDQISDQMYHCSFYSQTYTSSKYNCAYLKVPFIIVVLEDHKALAHAQVEDREGEEEGLTEREVFPHGEGAHDNAEDKVAEEGRLVTLLARGPALALFLLLRHLLLSHVELHLGPL